MALTKWQPPALRHEVAEDGRVCLDDRRAEHLRKTLKVEPGKILAAGVLGGGQGEAEVLAVGKREVSLLLRVEEAAPAPPWVNLVLALPRPAVLHRLLQTAAAMGVGRLDLVRSWRVEKSYFSSPSLRPEAIERHLVLGAEQGMRTGLPEVRIHTRLMPFFEELAGARKGGLRILAHPRGEEHFEHLDIRSGEPRNGGRATLAIGPEGGWIDREVESFQDLGFQVLSLGPWILRVEVAVAAALGQLALLERWRGRSGGGGLAC